VTFAAMNGQVLTIELPALDLRLAPIGRAPSFVRCDVLRPD
jgi:hypothetical protein